MKKKRAVAGGLLLVLGIAQSVSAETTTVTYHVDPSYMVLVPANTTIPFNEESVNYGKIRVEEAQIEEGKCIQVELISDKKLKNQSGKEGEIPYEILADTTAFTKARYTTAGKRRTWYHDRQRILEKSTVRLLCGYSYFSDILCGCDRLEQEDGQMKKAAIILMGICLCLSIPVAAEAAQTGISSVTQQSTINTTVPDTHMVTIRSEHAQVSYQHEEGDDDETQETVTYAVERFSSPQFLIQARKGWKITAVLVNGEDVTDQLKDGMLTLPEVYEDQLLVVETEESTEDGKKDDKKDGSTGGGGREDTKPTDKKPTDTKNNGTSGNSNSGTKTNVSTGNSQGTKADLTGTTNGTAAAKTADLQKNVMYFMAAIVSGAVLLILADNRRKRKHGE